RARFLLAKPDAFALEVAQGLDRAVPRDDDVDALGEERRDRAQIGDRALALEDAEAVMGPGGDVGLAKRRFELTAADQIDVLHRALRRLRHGDEAGNAAIAAALAIGRARRAGDRAGEDAADLKI